MAVTLDTTLGTGNSSGAATTTITTTAAVASGGRILVMGGRFWAGNTNFTVSGGGLTWAEDVTLYNGSNVRFSIWSAAAASGLASSTALTITYGGGATPDA